MERGRAKTRLRKAYVAASWFVVDQNVDQGRTPPLHGFVFLTAWLAKVATQLSSASACMPITLPL